MLRQTLSLVFMLCCIVSFAQTDTLHGYFDERWNEVKIEKATYHVISFKKNDRWHERTINIRTGFTTYEGVFLDEEKTKPDGTMINYNEKGIRHYETVYEQGRPVRKTFFYEDGKKNSEMVYGYPVTQTGWDENGNVIPDFIVERPAVFKGGNKAWVQYLERNLRVRVADETGAPKGSHTAVVSFTVDQQGKVSDLIAEQIPDHCRACADEAIRVIRVGPKWEPAIQNNKPVIFRQKQSITFVN